MNDENIVQELEGKTIRRAWIEGIEDDGCCGPYDDEPYLFLEMDNGEVFKIVADYGGYTGNSEDEYRRYIYVEKVSDNE